MKDPLLRLIFALAFTSLGILIGVTIDRYRQVTATSVAKQPANKLLGTQFRIGDKHIVVGIGSAGGTGGGGSGIRTIPPEIKCNCDKHGNWVGGE